MQLNITRVPTKPLNRQEICFFGRLKRLQQSFLAVGNDIVVVQHAIAQRDMMSEIMNAVVRIIVPPVHNIT